MDRVCVGAVRVGDIIIYRNDLLSPTLKEFIKSGKTYVECVPTKRNNIFYDGTIILQEWDKYKVKALDGSLASEDFIKLGEFGDEEFGTLLFKNCIGIAKFKGFLINIESSKISSDEMDKLMSVVNTYIANLSFDFNQVTFSSIRREKKKQTELDYHIYLLVHNALSSEDNSVNIFRNFILIANNPCRTMQSVVHYEDISLAKELSDEALLDIFSGSSNLKKYNGKANKLAKKLEVGGQQYLPQEVLFEETADSFDNSENRFVKYFISWCLGIIERFNEVFVAQENFRNIELIEANVTHIKKLKLLLRQSFLKNVGEMQSIPMYSTVLTRRDGYRQIYSLFLGLKSMPEVENDSENIRELLENKSLDVLYENYCYFGMSEMIAGIYGQRLDKKKYRVQKSSFSKTLEKKTDSNYFEFERTDNLPMVRVHYNKNYVVESYSKSFDPDISIEIFDSQDTLSAMYVFDSKFKATISETTSEDDEIYEKRKYKYDDISKMHTYRDALKVAHGAFILYPGTEDKIFYLDEEPTHRDLLYGIGAFKLAPGRKSDFTHIRYHVEKLLKLYKEKEEE
ncbi:DUF2357 domain-containing protein [Acetivibrio ethanolgignens]|uniref:DUF2357 domain-containing protein n=1 Tax=Acetivibrio ethanolgignens TaxID=290052 RepID=A0A0V8QDV4_9FIRM|nr:DUF2357 domain-containing protein [Acetivibrio ethanolgignens]KSV58727.1 hypothetical protein ASU35_12010 [Acetivibrio ethanolgignens]